MMTQQKQKKHYEKNERIWIHPLERVGVVKEIQTKKSQGIFQALIEFTDNGEIVQQVFHLKEIDKLRQKTLADAGMVAKQTNDKDTVLFAKVRPDAAIPSKRTEDAGYDVYSCFDQSKLHLKKNQANLVPTGIAIALSNKYYFNLKHERSSTGKLGASLLSGVIDSGYRNEIFLNVVPLYKDIIISKEIHSVQELEDVILYPYSKAIAQGTIEVVPQLTVKEITYDELLKIPSERGIGNLDSTGK